MNPSSGSYGTLKSKEVLVVPEGRCCGIGSELGCGYGRLCAVTMTVLGIALSTNREKPAFNFFHKASVIGVKSLIRKLVAEENNIARSYFSSKN